MVTEESVMQALKDVYDPEIGVNVVDLGLVYRVEVHGGNVEIDLTMTTPACPAYEMLTDTAEQAIKSLDGVQNVHVELVWEPPWTPDMMDDDIKRALGFTV
jgi:metal-sulfur cluster biosynthetic enzyme